MSTPSNEKRPIPPAVSDLTELFDRYHQLVYRLCIAMLDDREEAEDATQEIFLRAYRAWTSYDPERAAPQTWLTHIAMNFCRSALRRRRLSELTQRVFGRMALISRERPEERERRSDLQADLSAALRLLDEPHRSVVVLRYYQGLSCAEIAQALDISEGTVHSRLYTARQRLRETIRLEEAE